MITVYHVTTNDLSCAESGPCSDYMIPLFTNTAVSGPCNDSIMISYIADSGLYINKLIHTGSVSFEHN